jgi:ribosomal protein S18 acetylase RimI-like enzyme
MNEDISQNRQEKLDIKVELAKPENWQVCKELRLLSISGEEAKMFGVTPESFQEENNKSDEEWQEETASEEMFSVLAWGKGEAVGLGRARKVEDTWRVRNGYVKPEFRNMGIQQKMLALRLKEIIKRGGIRATTTARINNLASVHNIEKFGFKITDVDIGKGWNHFELNLTDPEVIKKINEVLDAG